MEINRLNYYFNQHLLFIVILLVHAAIFLLWQNQQLPFNSTSNTDKVLLLFALPQQKPSIKITKEKAIQEIKPRSTIQPANKKNSNPSESNTVKNQTQAPISQSEGQAPALAIQKNIHELNLSFKEDFLKQEKNFRPDSKSSAENLKKFSNALADAAQVQREGVIIEKKFAYDGRPVSKVKTPYGTYCVRHPKAGEKLDLSPPPLRVSCGEL
jgi:hypothetical protein